VIVNQWISELSEGVEAGLICIFIKPRILNEARVSSYIQDILRHEALFCFSKKHINMSFWDNIIDHKGSLSSFYNHTLEKKKTLLVCIFRQNNATDIF